MSHTVEELMELHHITRRHAEQLHDGLSAEAAKRKRRASKLVGSGSIVLSRCRAGYLEKRWSQRAIDLNEHANVLGENGQWTAAGIARHDAALWDKAAQELRAEIGSAKSRQPIENTAISRPATHEPA